MTPQPDENAPLLPMQWDPKAHDDKAKQAAAKQQEEEDLKRKAKKLSMVAARYRSFRRVIQQEAYDAVTENPKDNQIKTLLLDRIEAFSKELDDQCNGDPDVQDWWGLTKPVLVDLMGRLSKGELVSKAPMSDSEAGKGEVSRKWRKTYR